MLLQRRAAGRPHHPALAMSDHIAISEACLEFRGVSPLSYNQVRRLIERGELQGGKREDGRWWVSLSSVRAYRRLREQAAALPPAA